MASISSKLRGDGELLIDHRNSPGITPEFMAANKLAGPVVGKGQVFETALKNCVHCGTDVVLNPGRNRDREWCWACDAYICDPCALLRKLGAPHKPLRQLLGEIFDRYQRSF